MPTLLPARSRVLCRALVGTVASAVLLTACAGDAADPAPSTSAPVTTESTSPSATSPASPAPSAAPSNASPAASPSAMAPTEAAAYPPSGPDGRYAVGDVFSNGEFLFTYEGLVAVPLDDMGERPDGQCFFAVGQLEALPDAARFANVGTISFRPSFDPIFDGEPDRDQGNEFFNCAYEVVQDLGYVQTTTLALGPGDTEQVWIDAIWVSPEREGSLEAFRFFGMEDMEFTAEVTQDLTTQE